jgi:hypothetical protein
MYLYIGLCIKSEQFNFANDLQYRLSSTKVNISNSEPDALSEIQQETYHLTPEGCLLHAF